MYVGILVHTPTMDRRRCLPIRGSLANSSCLAYTDDTVDMFCSLPYTSCMRALQKILDFDILAQQITQVVE